MKPLLVLISAFLLTMLYNYSFNQGVHIIMSARIALAIMLLFTAIFHFIYTKGMMMMVPPFVPFTGKRTAVYLTGVLEIAFAIAIMFEATRVTAGYLLVIFFICLLPANIYTTRQRINMEKANHTGPGMRYLWFRIPLQLFLICWTIYFCIIHYY